MTYDYVSWAGSSNEDAKKRIDLDLSGENNKKINGHTYLPQLEHENSAIYYDAGLLEWLKGKRFEETFLEQRFSGKEVTSSDGESLELVKGSSTMWIIYKEI